MFTKLSSTQGNSPNNPKQNAYRIVKCMAVSDLTQKYASSQRFLRMPNGKKVFSSAKQAYNFLFICYLSQDIRNLVLGSLKIKKLLEQKKNLFFVHKKYFFFTFLGILAFLVTILEILL